MGFSPSDFGYPSRSKAPTTSAAPSATSGDRAALTVLVAAIALLVVVRIVYEAA